MKNVQRTMARGGLAFAICYLLFASCTDPLLKPLTDTEPSAPGMGRITITHDEGSDRTLLPNAPVFVSYTLSFTYQGEGEVNKDSETVTALPVSIELLAGPWLITVTAFTRIAGVEGLNDGNYPAATGSSTVTVISGISVPVAVDLRSGIGLAGQGVLEYDIGLSDGIGGAVLRILYMNKSEAETVNLLESASGSLALDAGYYLLQIQIATGRIRSRTELLHIYSGHTTVAAGSAWNFNAEEGVYYNLAELEEFLAAAPDNTADTPYPVKLMVDLDSLATRPPVSSTYRVNVLGALFENMHGKYISLDLSDSTGSFAIHSVNPERGDFHTIEPGQGRECIVSIILPEHITVIPPTAFSYLRSLKSINFPQSLDFIGGEAFYGCTSLVSVDLSATSITEIPYWTFQNLYSLEELQLPDTLRIIGNRAFETQYNPNNPDFSPGSKLTQINFPDSLEIIGDRAFRDHINLEEITLPSSLKSLGQVAFYSTGIIKADLSRCTELEEINWNYLFGNCRNLEELILPLNIGTIPFGIIPTGGDPFFNCDSLNSLAFAGTQISTGFIIGELPWLTSVDFSRIPVPPQLTGNPFINTSADLIIYVAAENLAAYRAAPGWNAFGERIQVRQ